MLPASIRDDDDAPRPPPSVISTISTSSSTSTTTIGMTNQQHQSNPSKHDDEELQLPSPFKSNSPRLSLDDRSNSFGDETRPFHVAGQRLSFDGGERTADDFSEAPSSSHMPRNATWTTAGLLMIADVVGAGVMTLATAFAQLGWVLSFASLVFWYVVNMYVGMLLAEARETWPRAESFQQMSLFAFGTKARLMTGAAVYTFLAFVLGDYLLILGESLQMVMYDAKQCPLQYTIAGAILLLLPATQFRLLAMTKGLMILNVVTIIGSIMLAFGRLATMDSAEAKTFHGNVTVYTEAFSSNLTLLRFFHSQALFAFAYMGVFIYLEIISEMKDPKEFKYSLLYLSGPFQFVVYGITGAVGYALIGSTANGLLIKQMPTGAAYRMAALFLSIHMVLTFLVKCTILSRAVHALVSPSTAKDFNTSRGHRVYAMIALGVLFFCFLVAVLIPFFDDLTSLLGAMQTPFIGFILPIFFALKARKTNHSKLVETSRKEAFFMLVIVASMILLFFVGVVGSVSNIVDKWSTYGGPLKDC